MKDTIKSQTVKALSWSAIERFSVQGIQFATEIVLARLLFPEDFGLIGMLAIFIAVSQIFIDSGFSKALVQKKERTDDDFSTVFLFNIGISIVVYLVLYFSAPLIASFYDMPQLVLLTRVLSLTIILNSLTVIQLAKLTIDLNFKAIAKLRLLSSIIAGVCAISFAYAGFGVWSIVILSIVKAFVLNVGFWFMIRYVPRFVFSISSFKELFKFGSKLLTAGLLATIFQNIYFILIGKMFSARILGFYTKADQFSNLTAGTITSIIQNVSFPILSSLQDDKQRLIIVYRRLLRLTSLIIFPIMTMLALLAEPITRILLTDKWLIMVPLLQWLCFARLITPISALNMNILNAIGRSDLYLKVDLVKMPLTIISLVITIPLGVEAVVIGSLICSVISFFINTYYPNKLFKYGAYQQIADMKEIILSTVIMTIVVLVVSNLISSDLMKILIGSSIGVLIYYFSLLVLQVDEIIQATKLGLDFIKRKNLM